MVAIQGMINRVFGTRFDRSMKKIQPIVDEILRHEERLSSFSEEELGLQTERFRERVREQIGKHERMLDTLREKRRYTEDPTKREHLTIRMGEAEAELFEATRAVLDELLPEVFATVREACRRLIGREITVTGNRMPWDMVPYDVQLIGGIVLHQGNIAEMTRCEDRG